MVIEGNGAGLVEASTIVLNIDLSILYGCFAVINFKLSGLL